VQQGVTQICCAAGCDPDLLCSRVWPSIAPLA